MKRNAKFFTVVIALLLLSSFVLTGGMYAIGSDNGEEKPYNQDATGTDRFSGGSQPGDIVQDVPISQSTLQSKFNKYLHVDTDESLVIFTPEQYEDLTDIRESGNRTPLSYHEILFLINDSVNLYFKNDKICLYNGTVDMILPETLTSPAQTKDYVIYPYHGDYSEFDRYEDAMKEYNRMLREIYTIIFYRIYMHDAGFARILHFNKYQSDELITGIHSDTYQKVQELDISAVHYLLPLDEGTASGLANDEKLIEEYKKIDAWERAHSYNSQDVHIGDSSLNFLVLGTTVYHGLRTPPTYTFCIYNRPEAARLVYPTQELLERQPAKSITYRAGEEGEANPIVHLDYQLGHARISAGLEFSLAITGTFRIEDGVLKVSFGLNESNPDYWYVFDETEEGFRYSAENSKPENSIGYNWADGLVFKKYMEHPMIDTNTNKEPPTSDGGSTEIVEEVPPAFKLDADTPFCSLMVQGASAADGSYEKTEKTLVLLIKEGNELYRYVFLADGKTTGQYIYEKGVSVPIPGYEIEAETKYFLEDPAQWGSSYLKAIDD